MPRNENKNANEDSSFPTISIPPSFDESGKQIGPYKLLRKLGEGGWGIVYLAEQEKPIRRQVALKLIKRGMESKQVLARFEAERQALALLDSPYIAHVYDAGMTEDGRPYFAMEYIQGLQITDYCDQHKLSIKERLQLFIQVCEGIQHAHQKGIIHRDIKPSNVLVSMQEEKGVPKIIDFGVAKALHQPLTEKTIYTEEGQLIGTPEYMSPEQAQVNQENVDIRSDVYSLGILLYELLTGMLPFDRKTLRLAAFYEILRIIREQDPPRPSAKLSTLGPEAVTIAQNRKLAIHALKNTLHKELEWIPLKAMRKEPSHRYQTALDFIKDIQNYLAGEPLSAGPESLRYRTHKFIQRNKIVVGASLAVFAILIIGVILSSIFAVGQSKARKEAESATQQEQWARERETNERIKAERQSKRASEEVEKHKRTLYFNSIALADNAIKQFNIKNAKTILSDCPKDLRQWEWYYLWHQSDMSTTTLRGHSDEVTSVLFSNDSNQIGSGSLDGTIRQWDLNTGREIKLFDHKGPVASIAISPDKKVIASGSLERNRTKIWDAVTGENIHVLTASVDFGATNLGFTPNGDLLVADEGYSFPKIYSYNTNDWDEYSTFESGHGYNLTSMSIHSNGQLISTGSIDGSVTILDLATKKQLTSFKENIGEIYSVAFSHNGKYIAYSGDVIKLWDIETKKLLQSFKNHEDKIYSIVFSPDDTILISGSADNTIKLWSVKTGEEEMTLHGHIDTVQTLALSSDGKILISGSKDKTIKVWALDKYLNQSGDVLIEGNPYITSISISPDGREIVAGSENGMIIIWDVNAGTVINTFHNVKGSIISISYSSDEKHILTGNSNGIIEILDALTGYKKNSFQGANTAITCISSNIHNTILGGTQTGEIIMWDMFTGTEIMNIQGYQGSVTSAIFSNDKTSIITGGDGLVKIWDIKTGALLKTLGDGNGFIYYAGLLKQGGFMSDEDMFDPNTDSAIWYSDSGFNVWDLKENKNILSLGGQDDRVARSMSFSKDFQSYVKLDLNGQIRYSNRYLSDSIFFQRAGFFGLSWGPDSKNIALVTMGHYISIFDVEARNKIITFSTQEPFKDISFSPHGDQIASVYDTIKKNTSVSLITILDVLTGHEIITFGDFRNIDHIKFSPVSNLIASTGDNDIRIWDSKTGLEFQRCAGHTKYINSICFSPDGQQIVSGSEDKTIKLWDVYSGIELKTFSGHDETVCAVAFSPDGRYVASGSEDKTIIIWDIETGEKIRELRGHDGTIWMVSFSPDGKRIVSGSSDRTVKLWDMDRDLEILTVQDPDKEAIMSVSFSLNGKYIAYQNIIGAVRIMDSAMQETVENELWEEYELSRLTNIANSKKALTEVSHTRSYSSESNLALGIFPTGSSWDGLPPSVNINNLNIDRDFKYYPDGWPMGLPSGQSEVLSLSQISHEKLVKEPIYHSKNILYGYLLLGNAEDNRISYVLDVLEKDNIVLYIDKNNNEDLSDDGPPYENQGPWTFATIISFELEVVSGTGEKIIRPYRIWFWINESQGQFKAKYNSRCHYKGKVQVGQRDYTAIAYEHENLDALYRDNGLWIDLNKDYRMDIKTEHFKHGQIIEIEKEKYTLNLNYP